MFADQIFVFFDTADSGIQRRVKHHDSKVLSRESHRCRDENRVFLMEHVRALSEIPASVKHHQQQKSVFAQSEEDKASEYLSRRGVCGVDRSSQAADVEPELVILCCSLPADVTLTLVYSVITFSFPLR